MMSFIQLSSPDSRTRMVRSILNSFFSFSRLRKSGPRSQLILIRVILQVYPDCSLATFCNCKYQGFRSAFIEHSRQLSNFKTKGKEKQKYAKRKIQFHFLQVLYEVINFIICPAFAPQPWGILKRLSCLYDSVILYSRRDFFSSVSTLH